MQEMQQTFTNLATAASVATKSTLDQKAIISMN